MPLNVLENWHSTVAFMLGLVLMAMLFTGPFLWVPKADLEAVQTELVQARG
jgi:glucose uptake protein GlcU